MLTIRINDADYSLVRQGFGTPLLLLHGFTGSSESWSKLMARLPAGIEAFALDILGHGRSSSPADHSRYSMKRVAADIVQIGRELGLERPHLLGYSMGGRLALHLALDNPAGYRSLILESASPGIADDHERARRRERDWELAATIERDGINAFVDRWESLELFASQNGVSDDRREQLRQQRLKNDPRGLANSLRGMGTGSQEPHWDALPKLRLSTHLICGGLDEKYVRLNAQMDRRLPHSTMTIVPSAGHNVHFEHPQIYARVVSQLLRSEQSREQVGSGNRLEDLPEAET